VTASTGNATGVVLTKARRTLRQAITFGTIIAGLTSTFVIHLDLTADPEAVRMTTDRFPLPVSLTVFASILLGMGLGTQVALLGANWNRIRAVIRPNTGRVICCIILSVVAPMGQFWGIPFAAGFHWAGIIELILTDRAFSGYSLGEYQTMAELALTVTYPPLFYLFSCLVISGIRRRFLRVAVFGQIWLAAYGAVLMIFGLYSGNM